MSNSYLAGLASISLLVLTVAMTLLSGCSSTTYLPPTTESSSEPELIANKDLEPEEVTPESVESKTNTARNNVAGMLLAQSETLRQDGKLPQAVALLERAIRLEPSRGDLWVQLGRLRFEEGELARAEQYARKGIALTRSEEPARRLGWLVLADVSEARGDRAGAEQIRGRWINQRG